MYTFGNIFINFEDTKMVDHILKISIPGVYDIRCLDWNTEIIVFMKKFRMDRRRYKSCHWIPMFIGTPCSKILTIYFNLRFALGNSHDSKIDFSEALKIITPPNPLSLVLSLFLGSHKAGRWALLGLWVDRLSLLTWVAGWARLSFPWVETEQNLCLAGSRDTEAKLNHPSLNIAMVQLYISRTRICLPPPLIQFLTLQNA